MHHELPARLDFEWYRKQAKELVREFRAGDPEAVERVEDAMGERAHRRFALTDAQWVIASEHGHKSWAQFKHWVETRESEPPVGRIGRQPVSFYEVLARSYLGDGVHWRDARLRVAREYGFPTWRGLVAAVKRAIEEHEDRPSGLLGDAFELMQANEYDAFKALLDEHPQLARATYRGASTTLLGALAQPEQHHVELRFAELLVERGADTWEALNLAACFNHVPLVRLLVEEDASQAPSEIWGITPMQAAVSHGSKEAADLLELEPDAFYLAAGAGRIEALDGAKPLRPNLTDVGWAPVELEEGEQAVLDEAFALAAYNGRVAMMEELVRRGANVHGRAHGMTALTFAVIRGRHDVVEWLTAHGGVVDAGDRFEVASMEWRARGEERLVSGLRTAAASPWWCSRRSVRADTSSPTRLARSRWPAARRGGAPQPTASPPSSSSTSTGAARSRSLP